MVMLRSINGIQLVIVAMFILPFDSVSGNGGGLGANIQLIEITDSSVKFIYDTRNAYKCNLTDVKGERMDSIIQMTVGRNGGPAGFTKLQPNKKYSITCARKTMMKSAMFTTLPVIKLNAITGSSVKFVLKGNLKMNTYNCTLRIAEQSFVANWTKVDKRNTPKEFTGLKPGTEYNITCTRSEDGDNIKRKTSKSFGTPKTAPGAPTIREPCTNTTCSSITLYWTAPNNTGGDKIQNYTITYFVDTGDVSLINKTVAGNITTTTLKNLSPNTNYNVLVRTSNSEFTGDAANTTRQTEKRIKGNLTITTKTESSLTFTQSIPEAIYVCKSTNSRKSLVQQLNITEAEHTLTGLKPDTTYTVDCVVYKAGVEACLELSTSVKTLPSVVTKLRKSGKAKVMRDQIRQSILWEEPAQRTSKLTYIIKYGPASEVHHPEHSSAMTTTSNSTTVKLTIHIPSEPRPVRYNVWVAAMSNAGQGQYSDATVILYDVPHMPKGVAASMVACNKMSISWNTSSNTGPGRLPVESYDVVFTSSSRMPQNKSYNTTFIILDNLSPETQYTITVRARNIIGWSNNSEQVNASTKQRDITKKIIAMSESSTTITIMRKNGQQIYSCKVNETGSNNNHTINKRLTTIQDLKANTKYAIGCVEVAANGHYQCSEYNDTVLTGLPEVLNLTAVTAEKANSSHYSQTLSWGAVNSDYQVISNYSIKYGNAISIQALNSDGVKNATSMQTTTALTLPLPTSPTTYNVWVAAVGEETGVGEYSQVLRINLSMPGTPKNLSVGTTACNKLELIWTKPDNTGGLPIANYEVQYGTSSGDKMSLTTNYSDTSIDLANLVPNTMYTIKVRATTPLTSEYSTISTTTLNRTQTQNISTSRTEVKMLKLSSQSTTKNYTCWVNNTNHTLEAMNTALLNTLEYNTNYSIGCVEIEDKKQQCTEYNTTVQTGLQPVENLMRWPVMKVGNMTLQQTISWDKVNSIHQKITYYSIRYIGQSVHNYTSTGLKNITSTTNSTTLTLPLPTSPITYNVSVVAYGEKTGAGEYSDLLQIEYKAPGQPKTLNLSKSSCNQINVSWKNPMSDGGLPIEGYQLQYRTKSGSPEVLNVNHTTTTVVLSRLIPGTNYTVTVKAIHSINGSNYVEESRITAKRGNATRISVKKTSPTTIEISSSVPQKYYRCWISSNESNNTKTLSKSKKVNLSGLTLDTVYSIDCVETNNNGTYLCTEHNSTMLTGLPQVRNLTAGVAEVINSTSFEQKVHWESMQSDHQEILQYSIKYEQDSSLKTYNGTDSQSKKSKKSGNNSRKLILPLPTSPTTYNVWVAAVGNKTGVGEYSDLLQLNYSAPQKPQLLNTSKLQCNKLEVTWTAPMDTGGLPIINYVLMYKRDSEAPVSLKSNSSTTTSISLDVLPGTKYTVLLRGNNSINSDDYATIIITTPKRMQTKTIEIKSKNNRALQITNKCTDCTYKCWINGTNLTTSLNLQQMGRNFIQRLKPGILYQVGCVEYDKGHFGCTEYNVTTVIGVPKVQGLTKVGGVTVNDIHLVQSIQWDNIPSANQNITHFIVVYGLSKSVNMHNSTGAHNITSTETTAELILPSPNGTVSYNVWVAAEGDKTGVGEYSDLLRIDYTTPDAPKNLTVTNISCNTMTLEWTRQAMSGGLPVTGYEVVISSKDESKVEYNNTMEFRLNPTSNMLYVKKGIKPNTAYRLQLTAINHIGKSMSTNFPKSSTLVTPLKDNLTLGFIPYSSTEAHLRITPPENKGNLNYSCAISSKELHSKVNTHDHNITLYKLTPNTTYSVVCLVHEDDQELCYKGIVIGQTFPSVPEKAPSNLTLVHATSVEITVEWDTPESYENNQDILGYNVIYRRATEGVLNKTEHDIKQTTSYTATELDAGTVYLFTVAAFTINGTGVYSDPVNISTIPIVENITITNIGNISAEIIWAQLFRNYIIWLEITVNDNFMYGNTSFLQINTTNTTKYHIRNRDPYREYTVEMYLQFGNLGNGSRENVSFRTLGTAPSEPPTNTTVVTEKRNAILKWGIPPPRGRNGIITSYTIQWTSRVQQTSPQTSPINHNLSQPNFTQPEQDSWILDKLSPYTNYTWRVAAVNINGTGPFSMWSNFRTKEDVPEQVEELIVIKETNSTIIVNWTEPSVPNGVIIEYEVCYWRLGNNCTKPILLNNTDMSEVSIQELEPGVPYKVRVNAFTSAGRGEETTYSEAIFTEELPPTETVTNITIEWTSATSVNISWAPLTLHQARGFPLYVVNITTKGRVVKNLTTNQTNVKVNELNRNTVYFVTVKPLTRGGDLEGETSEKLTFGTEPTQITEYIPIIVGAAGGLAVIVLLCIVLCIAVKVCCKNKGKQRKEEHIPLEYMNAHNDEEGENSRQRKTPIPREGFCEYVKNMHKSKNKHFITEFSSILQHPNSTHTAAENNPLRNRYINIYPYDISRVILMAHDGTDYINGAYVDGYSRPKAYIACQGPIATTIADFWQMIWEHKSTTIVMLTRLVEGDRPKCVQYWSEELNIAFEPGRDLVITTARIDTVPSYEVRHFEVRKTSEKADPLKVKHFLYTAWPDHGVPQYTSSMVKFILDQIKPDMKSNTAPIIVHCSAGAGRTGTFIAIDITLDRLEEDNTINIFECVEIMRTRRTQMVQNANQYMYTHDAINDHVTCGDTYIVAHELGQKISEMGKTKPGAEKTGFEEQFEILEKLSPEFSEADQNFALNPKVLGKIRYGDRFTYSENYIETENEEHYVNATHIKGYYGQSGFIAAQAPMKNTIEDTWLVIREQGCTVVVVLCELEEQEEEAESETSCIHFCPQEPGKTLSTENITVTALKAEETDGYTITEVSSIEEDEEPTITTLYHYKVWKKDGRPDVPSLLKLMGDVQRSHQGSRGPLMVMCDDGMSRTGVFITVMSEIDRVKVEGEMDIFHTVKAARTDRPHMVSTVLDYEVCHQIIHNYLESFDTYANFK